MRTNPRDVVEVAIEAGRSILEVYDSSSGIEVETKDDSSPLTRADIAAHETIMKQLMTIDPGTPIVSEEGNEGNPLDSELSWLVDPLDGTKEFIKRNGMFTVNIALMRRTENRWAPVFGVVHAPASGKTWFGGNQQPAKTIIGQEQTKISVNSKLERPIKLVASGSHRSKKDESFAAALGDHDLVRMGSSLKACAVAEGSADLYPRFGPTSCWDIAAAHAVVESAGGFVFGPDGRTLDYDLVENVLNPYFLVTCSTQWNHIWSENQD
tara:strand:+ start:502 stop:1302 length:801 start_codon:yes stop_codon:yes gene_type:complete